MKNILVTGANGQLGNEMRVLSAEYKEYTCFFTDVAELDICDEQAVMTFVKENNIHVIVNCAAYTAVDKDLYPRAIPHKRHYFWAINRGLLGRLASI